MLLNNINFTRMFFIVLSAMAAILIAGQISVAWADNDKNTSKRPAVSNAKWVSECGACHVAYPPHMLAADSWRVIMAGLDKHFGSNASLDAESAKEITAFLEKNASTKKNGLPGKPQLRITETGWIKSEHKEVTAHTWKNTKVKSPANCGACHTKAESGDFSERNVKLPK